MRVNHAVDDGDGRASVEVLADEYIERRTNGEAVTIDEYAAQYPDLADDIREVFPAVEAMKSLSTEWKRTVVEPSQEGPELPFQLGDYRLDRKIGRGGMGIVYEAEHMSLQRRVAVKILRMFSLNSDQDIQRFHREAQAAAQLHHTNIVPVFDFGQAEGLHYIAMQLIQGEGLDVVVERLKHNLGTDPSKDGEYGNRRPTSAATTFEYGTDGYWQTVADMGIQAASALQYAHSQGTVHRDIKPANLLLDDKGVIWVADFGLARQADAGRPTQSGILSGTLRYLAPEHFHGRCDERADQYGLGLSLYELTTLQSAVGDAGSHAEIMRRIAEAKIIPPRQLNARIPRDLDTIIRKCISANPAHRYANCMALGEDLQRLVDGRPIRARPVSRIERSWRWAKRHPALAAMSATSLALLMLVAVVATLGYRAEFRQRQRAEATSAYAQEALDTVFDRYALTSTSGVITDAGVSSPVLSQEAVQVLERLLPIFDRLAELDGQSPNLRLRATVARRRVGDIQQRLGEFEQAMTSYRQAAAGTQSIDGLTAAERALRLSEISNEIGKCQIMLGRIEDSRSSHEGALKLLQPFAKDSDTELTLQLARTHFLLTRRLRPGESPFGMEFGAPPPPRPPGREGWPGHGGPPGNGSPPDRIGTEGPRRPPDRRGRGGSEGPPGSDRPRRPGSETDDDARVHLDAAIALLESIDDDGQDPRGLHLLALCLKGRAPDRLSDRSEVEQESEDRALDILQQLVIDFPAVSEYRHAWVSVLAAFDTQQPNSISEANLPAAESRLRRAIREGKQLVAMHPFVPDYTLALIHAQNRLAHVLERRAEKSHDGEFRKFLEHALAAYQSAAALQSGLAERFPHSERYREWSDRFEQSIRRVRERLDD